MVAGCASGDDDDAVETDEDTTETTAGETTETTAGDEEITGPAPGVTDDTIKIGVNYVDTASLTAVGLNFNLGDYQATYQALADAINAGGGINGRQLEVVFAPIDPTGPASADAACLKLTEDDDVFLVTGFFLGDAVTCPLDAHATAVVGGGMTPARLELAKAPWITWMPDTDQPNQVLDAFNERGELDGSVAVVAHAQDAALMEDTVLPKLSELGIEPVETATIDAPTDDTAALQSNVTLIAERFNAAGADTVLVVGIAGANWPLYMEENPYRPKLLFTDVTAARAFATNESTTDTSILDNSLSGGSYGPDQARWEDAGQQACIETLAAAGVESPPPDQFDANDTSNQPYQAAFFACPDMGLMLKWLEAAGENLNYGTLEAALDGLTLAVPGDPGERTFGPPPASDGDPIAYLFTWNDSAAEFEVVED